MNHVVLFSGGLGSWAAAKRVAKKFGTDKMTLLFCDTLTEDPDLYRFLDEGAENVGAPLVRLCDGRTIWEVFRDECYLGNSRIDPCSKILKRKLADRWFAANHTPDTCVRYVGIDWTESHRYDGLKERLAPWPVEAPMCEAPYMLPSAVRDWLRAEGIRLPRLYELGLPHNNCGGGCVKAGMAHFAKLYQVLPARYLEWEHEEQKLRDQLGNVSILRDRSGKGKPRPLTLRDFRLRLDAGDPFDCEEWGGCSCFAGYSDLSVFND